MANAPVLRSADSYTAYRIAPADTVRIVPLTGPVDGSPASAFLEIWDPEGQQPDNSHPDSVELFIFLKGSGIAYSDANAVHVKAGDTLTLPVGSVHRIVNTSTTEKLYSITIMTNDRGSQPADSTVQGFYDLVVAGTPEPLDDDDLAVAFSAHGFSAPA